MPGLSMKETIAQSKGALSQWEPRWIEHSLANGIEYRKRGTKHKDLLMKGTGKTVVIVGMGHSFEDQIETLKKYRHAVEVCVVDKGFRDLLNHGIKPDYVMVADAMVSYEKYCEPYLKDTDGVVLISAITANPKWAANWKGSVYFYVNKDNIFTEIKFAGISGCYEALPAASNVGNASVVFMTQILAYDTFLLMGWDHSWGFDDPYYAFDDNADKRGYMHHMDVIDSKGEWAMTSQNLLFSARWLGHYSSQVPHLNIVNCSSGVVELPARSLETQLRLAERRGIRKWTDNEKQAYLKQVQGSVMVDPANEAQMKAVFSDPKNKPVALQVFTLCPEVIEYVKRV